jgi:CheY-like chemotaxis protein
LRDQSTWDVHRADAAARRAGDWLKVAEAHAPVGFDESRDGILIHRGGTVLYVCSAVSALLGVERHGSLVGSALLELFDSAERALVAFAVSQATGDVGEAKARATLLATETRRFDLELTAFHAEDASPPLDVLYLCSVGAQPGPEGREMERRDGEQVQGDSRRVTVLICDDEARLGALTAGLLSEYGFAPVTVGNGDEALVVLAQAEFGVDVVLLDVHLSEGPSAGDVLAAMQRNGSRARVILTSGLAEEDLSVELLKHPSVVGYVAKPYGVDQLIESVRTAVARGHS